MAITNKHTFPGSLLGHQSLPLRSREDAGHLEVIIKRILLVYGLGSYSTYIRSHVPKLVVDPPDLVIEGCDPALEAVLDEGWWIITATKIR